MVNTLLTISHHTPMKVIVLSQQGVRSVSNRTWNALIVIQLAAILSVAPSVARADQVKIGVQLRATQHVDVAVAPTTVKVSLNVPRANVVVATRPLDLDVLNMTDFGDVDRAK